jgi:hypothetical protein
MPPCLSLSTSQNHRRSFYASATACILSLSSQTASRCCVVPLPIRWRLLTAFLYYTVCMKTVPRVIVNCVIKYIIRRIARQKYEFTIMIRKHNYHYVKDKSFSCILQCNLMVVISQFLKNKLTDKLIDVIIQSNSAIDPYLSFLSCRCFICSL